MQSVAGVDLVSGALQSSLARAQKKFSVLNPNKKRSRRLRLKQNKLNRQFGNKKLLNLKAPDPGQVAFQSDSPHEKIEFVSRGDETSLLNKELREKYYCLIPNSEFILKFKQSQLPPISLYLKNELIKDIKEQRKRRKIQKNPPTTPCKESASKTKLNSPIVILPLNDNFDEGEQPQSKKQRKKKKKAAEKARLAQLSLLQHQQQPVGLKQEPQSPLKKKKSGIMKEILENHTSPSKSAQASLPTPKIVLYPREKIVLGWRQKVPAGSGLFNMGNTCYLNATLQALFHVPSFVNWLLSDEEHRQKCHGSNNNFNSYDTCTICAMYAILKESHKQQGMALRPHQIFSKLKFICKHFNHGRQEDAHEFLRYLLESMERSYLNAINGNRLDNRSKETTPLGQIFGGYMRTEVTCLKCQFVSTTFQPLAELQLEIKSFFNVEDCIQYHFRKERLENNDYKCEKCLHTSEATKQFSLESPPVVLCLQLKRFTLHGTKLGRAIQCNKTLNLARFLHKSQLQKAQSEASYHLVALINHMGSSPNCGHYTATAEASNGLFYHFDDSFVRTVNSNMSISSDAYVIIYELDKEKKAMNGNGSGNGTTSTSSYLNTQCQNQNNRIVFHNNQNQKPVVSPIKSSSPFIKSNNENEYSSFKSNADKKFTPPLFKASNLALKNGFNRPASTITSNSASPSNNRLYGPFSSNEKFNSRPTIFQNLSLTSPNSRLKSDEGSPVARKTPFHQTYSNRNLSLSLSNGPSESVSKSPSLLSSLVPYNEEEEDEEEPKIQTPYHPNTPPRSPLKPFDGAVPSKKRLFPDNHMVPVKEKKLPKMTPEGGGNKDVVSLKEETRIDMVNESPMANGSLSATSVWKVSKDTATGDKTYKEYSSDPETRKLNDNSDFSRLRKIKAKRAKSMERLVGVDQTRGRNLSGLGKFSVERKSKEKLVGTSSSAHSFFSGEMKVQKSKSKSKSKSPETQLQSLKTEGGGVVNGAYVFSSPENSKPKLVSPTTQAHATTNGHSSSGKKRSRSESSLSSPSSSNQSESRKAKKKKKKSEKHREVKHKEEEKPKEGSQKEHSEDHNTEMQREKEGKEKQREGKVKNKDKKSKKKKKNSKKRESSISSSTSEETRDTLKNGGKFERTRKFLNNLFHIKNKKKQDDPETTLTDLSDHEHSQKSNSQSSRSSENANKFDGSEGKKLEKFDPEKLKTQVLSWNGERGNLSKAVYSDKKRLLEKSKEDIYNEELDEGKTKKKAKSSSDSNESDVSNKFQRYEDNRREVKKWDKSDEIQVYEGYGQFMRKPSSISNDRYHNKYLDRDHRDYSKRNGYGSSKGFSRGFGGKDYGRNNHFQPRRNHYQGGKHFGRRK